MAIVNRVTGEDMPYAAATFDGRTLRLQMLTNTTVAQSDMPWLQMTWTGTRFDGMYVDRNGKALEGAVVFKLIRAKQ